MRQNLALAIGTAAALFVGAFLGRIDMAGGLLLHELSIGAVLLNSARLLRA